MILAAFLLGLTALNANDSTLRVGVFVLFRPIHLVLSPNPGGLIELETDEGNFVLEGAQSARLRLSGSLIQCLTGECVIHSRMVRTRPRVGAVPEFTLGVPGKIERRFRGVLEVSPGAGALIPVVVMDRETAVSSALAAESPPGASMEALKAQAVTMRSYYAAERGRHQGYEFCDTTHCQFLREPPGRHSVFSRATEATRGLVLAYRGVTIPGFFAASCGGRTHSLEHVGMRAEGYPYYSVECAYCRRNAREWETRLPAAERTARLQAGPSEKLRLQITREFGWSTIPGNHFSVSPEGEALVVRGRGAGHGVGLCQQGAAGMARSGASFLDILRHYFPNTQLAAAGSGF